MTPESMVLPVETEDAVLGEVLRGMQVKLLQYLPI